MSDDGVSDQIDEYARVRLDYHPSSGQKGAGEKNHDHDAPTDSDGSGKATTTFNPNEGTHPTDDIEYSKLAKINDGMYKNTDEKHNRHNALRNDIRHYGNLLDFNDSQLQQSLTIVDAVDSFRGSNIDAILLAALTLGANHDDRHLRTEAQFEEIQNICNVSGTSIRNARQRLREEQ